MIGSIQKGRVRHYHELISGVIIVLAFEWELEEGILECGAGEVLSNRERGREHQFKTHDSELEGR